MIDLLDPIERWQAAGRGIALATVVAVERSAPRDPGAMLALNDRGEVAGSVSGGCVEAAVYEEAAAALKSGQPRLVSYGISAADAISAGLTCGGTIHVFIERLDGASLAALAGPLRRGEPVAIATRLNGERPGAKLVAGREFAAGTLGNAALDRAVSAEALAMLVAGHSAIRNFGENGEPIPGEATVFIQTFTRKPDMYIFGAVDFSRAMVHAGKFLGYRVSVVDARPVYATEIRFPEADAVVVAWPHEFLAVAAIDDRTAIVVLTHDEKFDIPLLQAALRTNAGYVGAMGSRATHQRRVAALHACGLSDAELARLCAPIGLDLGARTPEETAISIAAEIVALRTGRSGTRLTGGAGPVRGSVLTGERSPQAPAQR